MATRGRGWGMQRGRAAAPLPRGAGITRTHLAESAKRPVMPALSLVLVGLCPAFLSFREPFSPVSLVHRLLEHDSARSFHFEL